MATIRFDFVGRQSKDATRVAYALLDLLEFRNHTGPYVLTRADAEAVAKILNEQDETDDWSADAVEMFLSNCAFEVSDLVVERCVFDALASRVAAAEAELEQLRADLGLVHRYAVALEARIEQLEGGK